VCAHHLPQHVNDLAEMWLSSVFRVKAPTRLCQNRCDECCKSLGKLFFQLKGKRSQV
jgi:hypothetical protein